MNDKDRTKEDLINELMEMRRRNGELERSETVHSHMKENINRAHNIQSALNSLIDFFMELPDELHIVKKEGIEFEVVKKTY